MNSSMVLKHSTREAGREVLFFVFMAGLALFVPVASAGVGGIIPGFAVRRRSPLPAWRSGYGF